MKTYNIELLKFQCDIENTDVNASGIYAIENIRTGKLYIGQTIHFLKRWLEHQFCLCNNMSYPNKHIQYSFNKYGIINFRVKVIEYLPNDTNLLNEREVYWISYYRNKLGKRMLYNMTSGGEHPIATPELKARLSQAQIKRWECKLKRKHASEVQRKRFSDEKERLKHSLTSKKSWDNPVRKMQQSIRSKEMWKDETHRLNIRNKLICRYKDSSEHKKMSDAIKNAYTNPDKRNRVAEANRMRRRTNIERKKQSKISSELWKNETYRNNMLNVIEQRWKDPEQKEKQSIRSKEMWKNESYKTTVISKSKETKRLKREYTMKVTEDILYLPFIYAPHLRKLGPKQRWDLIYEIANILKVNF